MSNPKKPKNCQGTIRNIEEPKRRLKSPRNPKESKGTLKNEHQGNLRNLKEPLRIQRNPVVFLPSWRYHNRLSSYKEAAKDNGKNNDRSLLGVLLELS